MKIQDLATHPAPFVTPEELADYYAVTTRSIYRYVEKGALIAVRVGGVLRIPKRAAIELGRPVDAGSAEAR